jgi:tetratricopeptide (TPR) repeat protein
MGHHFISYSSVDGLEFALKLADALEAGPPPIATWLDKRKLGPGKWPQQIVEAIETCDSYPPNNHAVNLLTGIISLLSRDHAQAREEFKLALTQATDLLEKESRNYGARDTQGLALTGLALAGEEQLLPEAIAAYRAAWAINRDAFVLRCVLRLFDTLTAVDTCGSLQEVRRAAASDTPTT